MSPTKRLTVALVFLLIAIAILFAVKQFDIGGEKEGDATATPYTLLFPNAQGEEVTRVQVKDNSSQDTFVAEKKDEVWTILEAPEGSDTGLGIDEMRITNALTSIPSIQPSRTLSGLENLATYGLGDAAQYSIALTIGGEQYNLTVGSKNPGSTDYYIQLSSSGDIYLVGTYNLESVIQLLTEPPYIQPTPDPNATPSATPDESVAE
ncbi:MAG: DUF4340 domain-containing protein [Anaerolineae bacterium]|nr:DUF4340 domain-containing protein [Anaerolineae bacterium]